MDLWEGTDPVSVADTLDGFPGAWWIGGGWALRRFTAVPLPQADLDVSVFTGDVAVLLERFPASRQVADDRWWAGSGSAWQVDVHVERRWQGQWVFPLDPSLTLPLDEATWISDGVRYLRPDLALLFQARGAGSREDGDAGLDAALPWLRGDARDRLVEVLTTSSPGHPWLDRLT
ncbi:hypothetical protein [Umezawaea beigongshangensis]|uniref:hypothetical protein n=1 Tax=Umezawaea beigongshangensis TaxID=2780383 RepID=UPI0018F10D03|nr:hypothetical protein [Umezawaea beigongshangensis]